MPPCCRVLSKGVLQVPVGHRVTSVALRLAPDRTAFGCNYPVQHRPTLPTGRYQHLPCRSPSGSHHAGYQILAAAAYLPPSFSVRQVQRGRRCVGARSPLLMPSGPLVKLHNASCVCFVQQTSYLVQRNKAAPSQETSQSHRPPAGTLDRHGDRRAEKGKYSYTSRGEACRHGVEQGCITTRLYGQCRPCLHGLLPQR